MKKYGFVDSPLDTIVKFQMNIQIQKVVYKILSLNSVNTAN